MLDPLLRDKEDVFTVVTIVSALLAAPALLIFVARPDLFRSLDPTHLALIPSGVGFAFLMVCAFVVTAVREANRDRADHVIQRDGHRPPPRETSKDWHLFSTTAGFANLFLLLLTVWAYWHPIRLGANLVALSVALFVGAAVVHALLQLWPINWTNPTLEQRRKAAELIAKGLEPEERNE